MNTLAAKVTYFQENQGELILRQEGNGFKSHSFQSLLSFKEIGKHMGIMNSKNMVDFKTRKQ